MIDCASTAEQRKAQSGRASEPLQIIRAGEAYSLQAFQRLTGLKETAIRRAARRGLSVRRVATRAFILGDDWLEYLCRQSPHDEVQDQ